MRFLAKAMAVDLARHGTTINMIAPGPITVPRNSELLGSESMRRLYGQMIPMGEAGAPDDIANAALFLAEDAGHCVTGAEFVMHGGLLAQILVPGND
jgi:NAD(P)-dependent dehydrogenase (short-subunit alcohol dehydrogenase family)